MPHSAAANGAIVWHRDLNYQASTRDRLGGALAKIEHQKGGLLPVVGFVATGSGAQVLIMQVLTVVPCPKK